MPGNRRRHGNVVPLASLATWLIIALFVSGGGLYYVYCKNQLHRCGTEIRKLETELTDLRNQNEVIRARIARATSPNELRKLREASKNFPTGYVDISREKLVVLNDKTELRPVVNIAP
jgi:hypothetical protein